MDVIINPHPHPLVANLHIFMNKSGTGVLVLLEKNSNFGQEKYMW